MTTKDSMRCYIQPFITSTKEAIDKHWGILKVDPKLKTVFSEFMEFKRNKNLRDIGQKTIVNNKVK